MINLFVSNFIILCIVYWAGWLINNTISKKNLVFSFLLFYIFQNLYNLYGPTHLTSILTLCSFFLIFKYVYKQNFKLSLLLSLLLLIAIAISEFISMFIMNRIIDLNGNSSIDSLNYEIALLFSHVIFVCFAFVIAKMMKSDILNYFPKRLLLIILVPIFTLLIVLTVDDYFNLVIQQKPLFFSFVILAFSNILVLFFSIKSIKGALYKQKLDTEMLEKQKLEAQIEVMDYIQKNNFRFIHSFIHECSNLEKNRLYISRSG